MSDQEFRDRCARAMGLTLTEPQRFGRYWEGPGAWVYAEDWKPDVNYNHAMMMRDECERRGLLVEFARELLGTTAIGADWRFDLDSILQLARMSAPRIAEAALKVLAAKEASSARTQEDK